jgi:hypothetical protein
MTREQQVEKYIAATAGCRTNPLGRDRNPDAQKIVAWMREVNCLLLQKHKKDLLAVPERDWEMFFYDGDTPERMVWEIEQVGFDRD